MARRQLPRHAGTWDKELGSPSHDVVGISPLAPSSPASRTPSYSLLASEITEGQIHFSYHSGLPQRIGLVGLRKGNSRVSDCHATCASDGSQG